jgi:hypothetical protein
MAESTTLNVPKDVLQPIISAHITKAVVEALGVNGRTLVESAVAALLTMKVDHQGNRSRYDSHDDKMWIDWAIAESARAAAKEAITEYFNSHQSEVKKAIVKELTKTNSPLAKQLAESLVAGTAKVLESAWRMEVNFRMEK